MFKTRQARKSQRRGVILLVVLALLTLFAIVGLTFVLYANSAADNARLSREAETQDRPDLDPDMALSLFLGQLIYDLPDDESGVYSALRGHSLARTMYGNYDEPNPFSTPPNLPPLNDKPFNGTGPLSYPLPHPIFMSSANALVKDNRYLVNFTYFPSDGFVRDPERLLFRPSPQSPRLPYTGGFNVSYTYPDHTNMFLAVLNPATGQVMVPSFHRRWLFNPTTAFNNQANPNWTNPEGKYLTLRPRPIDMDPTKFPYPEDAGGDVKNLYWAPGGNDSIWIDINAPVVTLPDGRKVKMLVAPLILDLDNRINLNVHGNVNALRPATGGTTILDHAGHQGWGAWEVNLKKVLFADNLARPDEATEWTNLFLGNPAGPLAQGAPAARVWGRYGIARQPLTATPPLGGLIPRVYAPVDLDGVYNNPNAGPPLNRTATDVYELPQFLNPVKTVAYQSFPYFPPVGYLNGKNVGALDETNLHPSLYNALRPFSSNRQLPLSGLAALLRGAGLLSGGTNSEALTSDLLRLCPQNFDLTQLNPADPLYVQKQQAILRNRNLVTLLSMDLDRPGGFPYVWDPTGTGNTTNPAIDPGTVFAFGATTPTAPFGVSPPRAAVGIPYHLQKDPPGAPPTNMLRSRGTRPPAGSEYDPATWRSALAQLGKLDLNRPLTPYQIPSATNFNVFTNAAEKAQYTQAVQDRQRFAKDLLDRLRIVTGAVDTSICAPNGTKPDLLQFEANRWLAQLAVNIVDMIDGDNYMTPFNWYPPYQGKPEGEWVYGTELPRVVLNEVYVQHDNQKNDPGPRASLPYHVNVWVELHNPLDYTPYGPFGNPSITDTGVVELEIGNPAVAAQHYPVYQILLTNGGPDSNPNNTDGHVPPTTTIRKTAHPWHDANVPPAKWVIKPANQKYAEGNTPDHNDGFYVIGPPVTTGTPAQQVRSNPNIKVTLESPDLFYTHTANTQPVTDLLLQRLVCPNLPPNTNPADPLYNPYITVDYFTGTTLNEAREFGPPGAPLPLTIPIQNRVSRGRNQPYAAAVSQIEDQNPLGLPPGEPAPQPKHTFFRHNAQEPIANPTATVPASPLKQRGPADNTHSPTQTLRIPFDWLVHLDRALVSPIELMHVSAYKPHELTHRFVTGTTSMNGVAHNHRAAWFTQNERFYRLLEFVETRTGPGWGSPGGRVPGKLNINTLWPDISNGNTQTSSVFRAFANAQLGNAFTDKTQADKLVDQIFFDLYRQRTPAAPAATDPTAFRPPSPNDNPFKSLATGMSLALTDPAAANDTVQDGLALVVRGLRDTYLRGNPNFAPQTPPLFDRLFDPYLRDLSPTTTPPLPNNVQASQINKYVRYELLNKLFNNLTTRSNVFAVWLTVGFFEVTDDSVRPVKLGAEVGKAEGRNVRHRMFAIIDRTNLTAFATTNSDTQLTIPAGQMSITNRVSLAGGANKGVNPNTNRPWQVQPGMVLTYAPDTDVEQTVVVDAANQITITRPPIVPLNQPFTYSVGTTVINRGNPGPWPRYDPRKDPSVVPYFAIID